MAALLAALKGGIHTLSGGEESSGVCTTCDENNKAAVKDNAITKVKLDATHASWNEGIQILQWHGTAPEEEAKPSNVQLDWGRQTSAKD